MAWNFDGTGDWLSFGDTTILDGLSTFSFSVWVNMNAVTADGGLIEKRPAGASGVELFFDDVGFTSGHTDTITTYVSDASSNAAVIEGATSAISAGGWQHVAMTFISGDASGLRLYIDGAEDANSPVSTSSVGVVPDVAADLNIGAKAYGTLREINGKIAEAGIWNRVLGADEVALLAKGFSPLLLSSGRIFLWRGFSANDEHGLVGTAKGGAVKTNAHPRIIMPRRRFIPDSPTLAQVHGLTANDLSSTVTLDQATAGVKHNLTANDVSTTIVLDTPTVAQVHALTANDLTSTPILDQATIAQLHAFTANDLSMTIVLNAPTVAQLHILTGLDIASTIVLDSPDIGQSHVLTANDLSSTIVLDTPDITQVGLDALVADNLSSTIILSAATLAQIHALTANDLSSTITLGHPQLRTGGTSSHGKLTNRRGMLQKRTSDKIIQRRGW